LNSGALKRLMMLDLQRIEDEKLLQLPRLNSVATILDVLADRELPQVLGSCTCCVPYVTNLFSFFERVMVVSLRSATTAGSAHA
jgi:hypothetical protein